MSTDNNDMCANCGKGEEESAALKNCVACKMVKYCSRDCQKAHRSQHKKECRKRAAELRDEALFKQPPLAEDCPICFLRLPLLETGYRYQSCCGKIICSGCIHAVDKMDREQKCSFCRTEAPKTDDEELIKRTRKRVNMGDAAAMRHLGYCYDKGLHGLSQDRVKALELWHQSAELGYTKAYNNIGIAYQQGFGVERDEKKAIHYTELAAMGGDIYARHNLGCSEANKSNYDRALKHFMIAVKGGHNGSLKAIKQLYINGRATRDDYAKALQAYQAYLVEIKSDDRDKAAAFSDNYKYY